MTHGIVVSKDVMVPMRDGILLATDLHRPGRDGELVPGRWPTIVCITPYDKTDGGALKYAHPSWYARHGYIVAIQDCRGRWQSEGEWYPFAKEAPDGYDSVEWAASQPWFGLRSSMPTR